MKIKYHCTCHIDNIELIDFLKKESNNKKIKFNYYEGQEFFSIDFFSDYSNFEKLFSLIKQDKRPFIIDEPVFSKEEMESAEWFYIQATRPLIETAKNEYTFNYFCQYKNMYNIQKAHHRVQVNPFGIKKMPTWKTKFNFCSECCGDFSIMFCSDYAKEKILSSDIVGIGFAPVFKGDFKTLKEDINQMVFHNVLNIDAFDLVDEKIEVCPICGQKQYIFKNPMMVNFYIKKDKLPSGIDAFVSEDIFYEGFGEKLTIVSKKVYNLIIEDMKERHMRFIPVG